GESVSACRCLCIPGRHSRRSVRCLSSPVRTLELAALIEDNLELLLQRHAAKKRVQCFATRDAVVVAVAATVCTGHEMLNACVGFRQWLLAEEARLPLRKHQSVDWTCRHGSDFSSSGLRRRTRGSASRSSACWRAERRIIRNDYSLNRATRA